MQPFQIGLTFTGTVSAGAYTGGVIDFIIEALEEWEKQKARNREEFGDNYKLWDTPWHEVSITGLSGASGGGVSCGLILNSIGRNFEPVRKPSPEGILTGNDFYDAWVNMLGIDELLSTSDIEGSKVRSILNGNAIPSVADQLMKPERYQNNYPRNYIAPDLAAFITLSNLRGIPYEVDYEGNGVDKLMYYRHTDYAKFIKAKTKPEEDSDHIFLPNDNTDQAFENGFSQLKAACLGTCAFPGEFKAQPFTQDAAIYRNRPNGSSLAIPEGTAYQYMCSDGGALNTEPFELLHQYLLKINNAQQNERAPENVERAIIMVAPLETEASFDNSYDMSNSLFDILPQVLTSMRQEAMFTAEEISLALAQDVYSRYLITPVRSDTNESQDKIYPGITGSVLGAFGAFLSRDFREHDYFLGRLNAQKFLSTSFCIPELSVKSNPVLGPVYTDQDITDLLADGYLPLIPLCGTAKDPLYTPEWPCAKGYNLDHIRESIEVRADKLFDQLASGIKLNRFERFISGIIGSKVKKGGVNKIMEIIGAELSKNKL